MKKLILILFMLITGFGLQAQNLPFSIDHSFQPFFDFRDASSFLLPNGKLIFQRADRINDIWEDSSTGKIYLAGDFVFANDSNRYAGNVCLYNDGSLFNDFSILFENMYDFFPINDSVFFTMGSNSYGLTDSLGQLDLDWLSNMYNSVRCISFSNPYFYEDGSSLWSSGDCEIIIPPDTFPGRHIIKVDPKGEWDSTFTIDADRSGIEFLRYDSNRILMYYFPRFKINYGNHTVNGIWRTYLDGTLDTTFNAPISDAWADGGFEPVVEEDGKIFISGYFLLEGNSTYHTLVRLNEDGSLDTTFMNHAGPIDSTGSFNSVTAVAPTPDGGYLVGGYFNKYQGYEKNGIAKIDEHGAVEPQYFTGSGPDNGFHGFTPVIHKILSSAFGGYYVIGNFRDWNGQPSQPIIRLYGLNVGLEEQGQEVQELKLFPNPAKESIQFYGIGANEIEQLFLTDIQGKILKADFQKTSLNTYEMNISNLKTGMYFLKMISGGEVAVGKFVKR